MREQIAQIAADKAHLECGMAMDRALLAEQGRMIGDYKDFAAAVADAVGREAVIAGEPTFLAISEPKRPSFEMVAKQRLPLMACVDAMPINAVLRPEIMRLLEVDAIRDSLSQQMHVRVRFANGDVGYAMSELAIQRMPEKELVRTIVPEIVTLFARQLKEKRKREG
jgi:hypothetical protein